jgi:hypothetical protein
MDWGAARLWERLGRSRDFSLLIEGGSSMGRTWLKQEAAAGVLGSCGNLAGFSGRPEPGRHAPAATVKKRAAAWAEPLDSVQGCPRETVPNGRNRGGSAHRRAKEFVLIGPVARR